ncbi:MAG: hypothetical protein M3342_02390 [Bacteroidota bacterium]|nr:hypothetical protein [Bacteroidota bacterium]
MQVQLNTMDEAQLIKRIFKLIDADWEAEENKFRELSGTNQRIGTKAELNAQIQFCENNGWTEGKYYNLMLLWREFFDRRQS